MITGSLLWSADSASPRHCKTSSTGCGAVSWNTRMPKFCRRQRKALATCPEQLVCFWSELIACSKQTVHCSAGRKSQLKAVSCRGRSLQWQGQWQAC